MLLYSLSVYIEYSWLVIRWSQNSQPWFFFHFRILKFSWAGLLASLPILPIYPSFPVPLRVRVDPFRLLLVSFASAAPRFAQFFQTGSCRSTYHPLSSLCATLSALLWFSSTTEQISIDPRLPSRYRVKLVGSNDYRLPFSFFLSSRRILWASCLGCSEILCLKYV